MDLRREILHWSLGVITSAEPDEQELTDGALIRADNMMFTSIAAGRARPRTRFGMTMVNQTPYSNTSPSAGPAVLGGAVYPYLNAGVTTHYTVVVQANGDVHLLLDDGNTMTLATTADFVGALTNGLVLPDIAVMNNRVFIQDGLGGRTSIKGTTKVDWGVDPVTGLALGIGAAGAMTGDYEVLVTGWNDQILAESDRSPLVAITGVSADKITVTVNAVAVGLTHRYFRVYIRKATLGTGIWRVINGTGFVGGTVSGYPLFSASPTVSTTIDLSDTQINDLIIPPPPLNANGKPNVGTKFVTVYQRRLFIADNDGVYWSELDKPDSFNPLSYEPIKSRDPRGSDIVGLKVFGGHLHIFTETARITLTGDTDLRTWLWTIADPDVGASSPRAIVVHDKLLAWWDREHGPVIIDKNGERVDIGDEFIRNNTKSDMINVTRGWEITATGSDDRIIFAVPELGKIRNTKIFSFHTSVMKWESTRWDPMDASVLFSAFDSSKRATIYLGNYNGQLFRMLKGGIDGVRTGTDFQGTFVAGATSITSITDVTKAFDILGAGLIERKITILDSQGIPVTGAQRPRIIANTSTALTLSDPVSGLVSGATYIYIIGGPDLILETFWDHMGKPFLRKRFDKVSMQFRADEGAAKLYVNVAVNSDSAEDIDIALSDAGSGGWDLSNWDEFFWDSPNTATYRRSVIKAGLNYRTQVRSPYANQGFTLLKLGMVARELSDRYFRGY